MQMHLDMAEWLDAGRLIRAHGVHGEVRAILDIPGDQLVDRPVRLVARSGATSVHTVAAARAVCNAYLLTFLAAHTREQMMALAGARLQILRADVPPAEPGEFYIYELQAAAVQDTSGQLLGHVRRVADNGGQALLVIAAGADGATERLLPLVPEWVRRYDRTAHCLHVAIPQGLWEN